MFATAKAAFNTKKCIYKHRLIIIVYNSSQWITKFEISSRPRTPLTLCPWHFDDALEVVLIPGFLFLIEAQGSYCQILKKTQI